MAEAERLVGDVDGSRKLLIGITRNVARNRRRLHALARPHDPLDVMAATSAGAPSAEDLLVAAEEQLRFAGCLGKLVEVQRVVVSLRMLDGLAGDFDLTEKNFEQAIADPTVLIAARYDVRAMPTLLLLDRGAVVGQIVGAVPRAKIEALVAKALDAPVAQLA